MTKCDKCGDEYILVTGTCYACSQKTLDGTSNALIYAVEDDHCILYAGPSFYYAKNVSAGSKLRGVSSSIQVFLGPAWLGTVDCVGRWTCRTKANTTPENECVGETK